MTRPSLLNGGGWGWGGAAEGHMKTTYSCMAKFACCAASIATLYRLDTGLLRQPVYAEGVAVVSAV